VNYYKKINKPKKFQKEKFQIPKVCHWNLEFKKVLFL